MDFDFQMEKVFITENHHEVLTFWAAYRRENPDPLSVLTIDHHTDVVQAFRNGNRTIGQGAWLDEAKVLNAVSELKHDEHFDWAVRSGLIEEAFIASHTCATTPANDKLHICCDPAWPDENEFFRDPEKYRELADSVLETSYLFRQFGNLEQYGKFIFDIDCDYILTSRALMPRDSRYLKQLLSQAALITISLESDWVRLLKYRGENINSGLIADKITQMLELL